MFSLSIALPLASCYVRVTLETRLFLFFTLSYLSYNQLPISLKKNRLYSSDIDKPREKLNLTSEKY